MDNLVSPRTLLSEFTSRSAALIAIFDTLALMDFNVKMAPTFTTEGLEAPSESAQKAKTNAEKNKGRFMVRAYNRKWKTPPNRLFIST